MDLASELYGDQQAKPDLATDLYGDAPPAPVKLGQEGFKDAMMQTLQEAPWGARNLASAGLQLSKAWEGLRGGGMGGRIIGAAGPLGMVVQNAANRILGDRPPVDQAQIQGADVAAQEVPVGAFAGDVAKYAPAMLASGVVVPAAIVAGIAGLTTPGGAGERATVAATEGGTALGAGLAMKGVAGAAKYVGNMGSLAKARQALEDLIGAQNMPEALRLAKVARAPTTNPAALDVSAEQALVSLNNPNVANLARVMHGLNPEAATAHADLLARQQAGRTAAMEGATPNLGSAEFQRMRAAQPLYKQAEQVVFRADPQLAQMADNPYFKKAMAEASDLIEASGLDFKTNPTGYLQAVKFGFDKMLGRHGDTALSGAEQRVVGQVRDNMLAWLERKNPLFKQANEAYAAASAPVNQSKVLTAMTDKLQTPVGRDNPSGFLNILGAGEDTLLKRQLGVPANVSGDLQAITTPRQYGAVQDVAGQLQRNADLAAQRSSEGSAKAVGDRLMTKGIASLIPNILYRPAMIAHAGLKEGEAAANRAMMRHLEIAMRNPQELAKLLETLPVEQRNLAVRFLNGVANSGAPAVAGGTVADLMR